MTPTQIAWRNYYCRRWKQSDKIARYPNDIVRRSLQYKSSGRVLDIGSGAGRDAIYLARCGFTVEAIDLACSGVVRMNNIATQEHLQLAATVANASEYRFLETYDLVVSVLMLNHLSTATAHALIAAFQSHTNARGLCIISTITKESDSYRLKAGKDYFYPAVGELRQLFMDWEVLEYQERLVGTEAGWWIARAVENTYAELIARKI